MFNNSMIPNPTRTIVVNKPINFIMDRLYYLGAWSGKQTGITIVDADLDRNINTYNFKCQANIYGLIDLGNYGNVSLEERDGGSTRITIEMGKNCGCISDQFEAQDLNQQIQSFFSLLSTLIGKSDDELKNVPQPQKRKRLFGLFG